MSIEISTIKDAKLNSIAKQADSNNDNKLSGDEYQIFAQAATNSGVDYKTIGDTLQMNAFERWWFDVDKVATDGKDDGKLSTGEIVESTAKGFFGGILKGMVKNPITTLGTLVLGAAATIATGGAALPIIVGLGAGASAITLGSNIYKYAKADNDLDAKSALEGAGTATMGLALSGLGVKSANAAGAKAGVKSLQGLENASWGKNALAMIKAMPETTKQSGLNIKGNYLTWMSSLDGDNVIYANSNATREGVEIGYQSGNKVEDAYKVDLNGTVEEVLAKNPGLKYDAQAGKYYVQTTWGENMYVQNENYMYIKYGESIDPKTGVKTINHNLVEGKEFYDTYIDHAKFEANGTKRYINPQDLKPGQHVETSKNAPARYKIVPRGTKYMSAEGEGTVQYGSVLRIDGQGRPYQSTVDYMTKNVKLSDAQLKELNAVDPYAVHKNQLNWSLANNEHVAAIAEQAKKEFNNPEIQKIAIKEALGQNDFKTIYALREGRAYPREFDVNSWDVYGFARETVKDMLLKEKGIQVFCETDSYYGMHMVGAYYSYKGKCFEIPFKNITPDEAYNALIERAYNGNLPTDKSIFQ